MSIQFTNDATTFLAANINASVTTITVVDASSFPTLASGDHTYITLSTPTNSTKEIVKCTAIVGNTLTVIRAQEGTTAASFTTDDRAQIRITAQLFRDIMLAYASLNSYRYTATAGQTTFTGTDIHSATLAYLPNNIIVMLNGVGMGTVDYTATDGSSIVFNVGATLNDEITIVAFTAFGVSDHYKKSETDALLAGKVDDSQVLTNVPSGALFTDTAYTHPANHAISVITGLQAALDGKVDDSQVLTNVPSGALFTDTNTVYTHPSNHAISVITGLQAALDGKTTESYVNTAVSNLVDSSPATLNTLNELAAALGDDANFSTTVTNSIATKLPLAGGTMTGNLATAGISAVTAGTSNFVAGVNAGNSIVSGGDNNTVVGDEAGTAITTGDDNTAVGYKALDTGTGTGNTAIGSAALDAQTTANFNTAVGSNAGAANTTGGELVAVGRNALQANTTGTANTAVGMRALDANTTAGYNTAVGGDALGANTTGERNTAIGYSALVRNTTGGYNSATGMYALQYNTTGANNVASGYYSLASNTTGGDNTASGYDSLGDNTTGSFNAGFGYEALARNTTASNNTAMGYRALKVNTEGAYNSAFGHDALDANTTGSFNTATGRATLGTNTTGQFNSASGYVSLLNNTTGQKNTGSGAYTGANLTTGIENTFIGYNAGGTRTTGSNNVCIGYNAGHDGTSSSDLLFIARNNTGPSNAATWIFGDSAGACRQGNNATTWTQTSDERIKKNIVDSPNGLAKIDALQVRNFNYRTEEEITVEGLTGCDATGLQVGVIAQEIEAVLPEAVTESDSGQKQVQTDPIFWSMVKAIQELSTQNAALEARLTALEA